MFIHQKWLESRLEISDDIFEEGDDYVTLLPEFFDNLWQPDPYFLNSKIAGKFYNFLCLKLSSRNDLFACHLCSFFFLFFKKLNFKI